MKYKQYEQRKKELLNLPPKEYEEAIKKLAEELKI